LLEGRPSMKDYLLKLPLELHTKLKIAAALKGVSMMQFIVDAINEKLEQENGQ
jgi:predicted HicB family RNase H-like nuclease